MTSISAWEEVLQAKRDLRLLATYGTMARSDDNAEAFDGVLMIRKLLSARKKQPIQTVVDAGVVPLLVQYLACDDWPEMQLEAAWALSNIVAGGTREHTQLVIRLNAAPHFVRLLESENEELRGQAAWAVGNIAGQCSACRDYLLGLGAMPQLINAIKMRSSKASVLHNAAWALSSLCRSKPSLEIECLDPILSILSNLLIDREPKVASEACWAISYMCDKAPGEVLRRINRSKIFVRLVRLLQSTTSLLQQPALRAIGNIVDVGNDEYTQAIIDNGALDQFDNLLLDADEEIQKEALLCLSNICAGASDQIKSVIGAGLFRSIIRLMGNRDCDTKTKAVCCVTNACKRATTVQLRYLADKGAIPPLCRALAHKEVSIVTAVLECIQKFLQFGEKEKMWHHHDRNPIAELIVDCQGTEFVEKLTDHKVPVIRDLANVVLGAISSKLR